jgi:phospholipid-translocating ATPase
MHNKSIVVAIAFLCSVGGWFLWNIILAATYHNNKIYDVKDGFFVRFGRNALWWLTLILIVSSVIVFELGVGSLRAAWFPTDVDTFQELEQDLMIRKRFEEAASMELQQGWDRGEKRSSFELSREREERVREEQVQKLLANRPEKLEEGAAGRNSMAVNDSAAERGEVPRHRKTDIPYMLSRFWQS